MPIQGCSLIPDGPPVQKLIWTNREVTAQLNFLQVSTNCSDSSTHQIEDYDGSLLRTQDKNKILKEGLKPRSLTKYEGKWKESPSIENLIYLTDCYPIYFSVSAINSLEEENLCLFKVKVNANYLYPDEDFIYQLSKKQEETISSEESKKIVYLNKELWKGSLKHLGTVSYNKIILPSEILDYVEVSPKENPEIIWEGIQPTITLENKFIFGNKYKELTEYLFNLNNESK